MGVLVPKWLWVRFGGKLGAIVAKGQRNPDFEAKDERMTFL